MKLHAFAGFDQAPHLKAHDNLSVLDSLSLEDLPISLNAICCGSLLCMVITARWSTKPASTTNKVNPYTPTIK